MWFLIFGVLATVYLIYYWFMIKFKHFEELGMPGPKPKFPFGNISNVITRTRNITYDYEDIYKEFKDKAPFAGFFEFKAPKILVIDPETVKTVMVKSFKNFHDNEFSQMVDKNSDPIIGRNPFFLTGDEWKEKRAEITPAFTPNRIKALFPLVDEVLKRMLKYIENESAKEDGPINGRNLTEKFTTDVVSSCIFNADAESFTTEKPEIMEKGLSIFEATPSLIIISIIHAIFPFLRKIIKIRFIKKDIEEFFTNLMQQAIELREKHKINRDDYLAFLMELRKKKNLSDLDMAARGITFFTDGLQTSSVGICNALLELGDNKDVQSKLRKELEDVFDGNGNIIYEKLIENSYLDQVFHEGLRLHPPATLTNRVCTEATELEGVKGKKFQIIVGDSIVIPTYSIQRDPENYVNPEKFMPERFDPEHGGVKAFKDRGVLLAFGDGPRICLGMRFALMQSKAAIATLVKNFEISVNAKTKRPLEIDPKEFLNYKTGGTWLDFKSIN